MIYLDLIPAEERARMLEENSSRGRRASSPASAGRPSVATRHTPGPLYVGCMNDGLFIIDRPPRPVPADSAPYGGDSETRVIASLADNDMRARADATLYAAAPDLLEALKALLEAVKASKAMEGREYVDLGIQVHTAIRKATVGSSAPGNTPGG